jgi:hypothetical protein
MVIHLRVRRFLTGDGSQGPSWYAWAWIGITATTPTGRRRWLLARRSLSDPFG